jgi:hypothetical protein
LARWRNKLRLAGRQPQRKTYAQRVRDVEREVAAREMGGTPGPKPATRGRKAEHEGLAGECAKLDAQSENDLADERLVGDTFLDDRIADNPAFRELRSKSIASKRLPFEGPTWPPVPDMNSSSTVARFRPAAGELLK